jgi:Xaa-Pro aminopeptidase
MIMSTISSYDEALDFYPATNGATATGGSFTDKLRVLWEALSEGHAAAYRYRQLTARGKSADEAAAQVFAEFYASH